MKHGMRMTLVTLLAMLAGVTLATSALDRSLETTFQRADRIVYGRVSEVRVDVVDEAPVTRVVIDLERDLRDDDVPENAAVTLSFQAGEGPLGVTFVDDLPIPVEDDRVLVAYYEDDPAVSPVVGVWQGWWTLRDNGLTDLRGVPLGVTGVTVERGGEARDVTNVLDVLALALAGEGEARVSSEAWSTETASEEDEVPILEGDTEAESGEIEPSPDTLPTLADGAADDVEAPEAAGTAEGSAEGVTDDSEATNDGVDDGREAGAEREPDLVGDSAEPSDSVGEPEGASAIGVAEDAATTEPSPTEPSTTEAGTTEAADAAGDAGTVADTASTEPDVVLTLAVAEDESLRDALRSAAARWRAVGAMIRVTFDDAANDHVRVGDPALLGPDTLSLSRRVAAADGIEILVRPGSEGRRVDVLAYELGRLAGMQPAPRGFRSGRLGSEVSDAPSMADAASFQATLGALPEDVNGDGVVDFYDLVAVGRAYGAIGTRVVGDVDGSGVVDDEDVNRVRGAYEFLPASRDAPEGRTSTNE